MITRAERFITIEQAKRRWRVLEQRMAQMPGVQGLAVTAFLNGCPYMLCVLATEPPGFFDGVNGLIDTTVDRAVWLSLAARHEQKRADRRADPDVTEREPRDSIRLYPPTPLDL